MSKIIHYDKEKCFSMMKKKFKEACPRVMFDNLRVNNLLKKQSHYSNC